MSALTDAFENKLIDWKLRGQALGLNGATASAGSGFTNVYVGLITAAGSDAAAGTEVSGGGYARVQVACTLANWAGTQGAGTTTVSTGSSGTTSNNNTITFPTPAAAWGQVVEFGVFDSATGGTELWRGALGAAKTINNGDPAPYFPAGSLTFQIDN
jgi:hypothetical protein